MVEIWHFAWAPYLTTELSAPKNLDASRPQAVCSPAFVLPGGNVTRVEEALLAGTISRSASLRSFLATFTGLRNNSVDQRPAPAWPEPASPRASSPADTSSD
jgi:hypothetical protein